MTWTGIQTSADVCRRRAEQAEAAAKAIRFEFEREQMLKIAAEYRALSPRPSP